MDFDRVYGQAHEGSDTRSTVPLGLDSCQNNPQQGNGPAPLAFDSVYSKAHEGRDTRSSVPLGSDAYQKSPRGNGPAPMPFDRVYGAAHEGRDTRSSIPLGSEGYQTNRYDQPARVSVALAKGTFYDRPYHNLDVTDIVSRNAPSSKHFNAGPPRNPLVPTYQLPSPGNTVVTLLSHCCYTIFTLS
jgi:hypothetical protein